MGSGREEWSLQRQGLTEPFYDQLWHQSMSSVPVSSTSRTVVRASDTVSLRQLGTYSFLDRSLFLKEHILSSFLLKDKE